MGPYLPKFIERRVTIIVCLLGTYVAFIFCGPSQIFKMNDSLWLMGVGQALVGIFNPLCLIQGLPEMVDSVIRLPHFPKNKRRDINYKASGFFNAALGFGQIIAPLYGSNIKNIIGFRMTCDIVAIISLVFGFIYLFVGEGGKAFCLTKKNLQKERAR